MNWVIFGNVFMSVNRYFLDRKTSNHAQCQWPVLYQSQHLYIKSGAAFMQKVTERVIPGRVGFNLRYNIGFKKKRMDRIRLIWIWRIVNSTRWFLKGMWSVYLFWITQYYSTRIAFTGFIHAACKDCRLTIRIAMTRTPTPDVMNTQIFKLVLYSNS